MAATSNTFTQSDQHHIIFINDETENYNTNTGTREYTRPFLLVDMIWNMAFALVSVAVLLSSVQERPNTPLRLWICGYALQCLLHVGFVYRRWSLFYDDDDDDDDGGVQGFGFHGARLFSSLWNDDSFIQKMECINMIVSSIWWMFGFYWIVMGGQLLLQDSPRLYWLSMVFLAFDVFFVIFCILMTCICFFVLFCCFPILATVAYAMTIGEGASENDIRSLPKYLYRHQNALGTFKQKQEVEVPELSCNNTETSELVLAPEDSECCICLYKYVDGTELCTLPCNHHFHHDCIAKWLRIKATCPLCKLNVLDGDILV